MKFRKKPVVIEAEQLSWKNWNAICEFAGVGKLSEGKPEGFYLDSKNQPITDPNKYSKKMGLMIPTPEGLMTAVEGDWIIRGVKGELYSCKPDIFEMTYERVRGE